MTPRPRSRSRIRPSFASRAEVQGGHRWPGRGRRLALQFHPPRPGAMESGADHQRDRTPERGVPPPDQDPDRAALRKNRAHAALRPVGFRSDHHAQDRRLAKMLKDFRCGPWRIAGGRAQLGPRWKSSQGGSRGGLGAIYGESAQTFGATAGSGFPLKGRVAAETVTEAVEYADTDVHIAVLAGGFRAEER